MPGNRIVKIEWKNLQIRTGQADNYINVQLWAHQQSGVVELHYGPSSANNASGYTESGATVGPQVGMAYLPRDFSAMYEKLWVYNVPGNVLLDSNRNFSFRALQGVPPNGTIYRFVPRAGTLGISTPLSSSQLPVLYPNPATTAVFSSLPVSGILQICRAGR